MTYRDHLSAAMKTLAAESKAVVVGYNSTAGGTCECFDASRRFEMPLAENLMMGAAVGMSLDGLIPIVWFERFDFVLCAMDALVNHLDKLALLSEGVHRPACIIRVAVGNSKTPLFSGPTHTQNFSEPLRHMLSFPVIELRWKPSIEGAYAMALSEARRGRSTMLVEFRDFYLID